MVELILALLLQLGVLTGGSGQTNMPTSDSTATTSTTTPTTDPTNGDSEEDPTGTDGYGGTGTWDNKD